MNFVYLVVESLLLMSSLFALKGINTLVTLSFPVTKTLIFRGHCKQNQIKNSNLFPYFAFTKTSPSFESVFIAFCDNFENAILEFYNATSDKYWGILYLELSIE